MEEIHEKTSENIITITLKNLAGDLINLPYNKDHDTLWDFKLKMQTLFILNDIWRIHLFKDYRMVDEELWYNSIKDNSIKDGDVIEYFISDDTYIKTDIILNKILYNSNNELCSQYKVSISIGDDNYDYIFYSIDRNGDLFFSTEDNSTIHTHYNNNNGMEISILYIKEEDEIYKDIKSLFINNKIIPIMERERVVYDIVDKWNKNSINYQNRINDLIYNT